MFLRKLVSGKVKLLAAMAQMLAKPGLSGRQPITPQQLHQLASNKSQKKGKDEAKMLRNQQLNSLLCDTMIEHNTTLDIDSQPAPARLTHIICTIGPASREVPMLVKLMHAGMNICRLNFSHGTYDYHRETVQNIREAIAQMPEGFVIATALDTKGPEIRTGLLEGGPTAEISLETGNKITITIKDEYMEKCSNKMLWVDYKNIVKALKVNSIIYIDDGLISLRVLEKGADHLVCNIENGGKLGSKKGVNLPGCPVDLPAVSEKDKQDLLFGVKQGVDMVFASFIQNSSGIREIREVMGEKGRHIKILAKIESFAGIYNFTEVLEECDGAMVARGDMGIEIPPEKVFVAQKLMISACNKAGKPVICATQMLESMTYKPRATRSESNDVANAVLDGADCVMLSGESAKGLYPVEAVTHMASVCLEAESVFFSLRVFTELKQFTPMFADAARTIALSAVDASYQCMASAIIAMSTTGRSGYLLSQYRPRCPIIMVTRNETTARQSLLYRGIIPFHFKQPPLENWDEDCNIRIQTAVDLGISRGILHYQDTVILVMGLMSGPGKTNCIQIITCKQGQQSS